MSQVTVNIHDLTKEQYDAISGLDEMTDEDDKFAWKVLETPSVHLTLFCHWTAAS